MTAQTLPAAGTETAPAPVACFGAAILDLIARADRTIKNDTSTPGEIHRSAGGVAGNVARVLAGLDVPVYLKAAVGKDEDAQILRRFLSGAGVTAHLSEVPNGRTGQYLALHDPDGSLVAAVADIALLDTLPANGLAPVEMEIVQAPIWFLEANLPAEILEALTASAHGKRLVADAVSIAKAQRLQGILDRLDLLFLNADEARCLAGVASSASLKETAARLHAAGPEAVVITDGSRPVHLATAEDHTAIECPSVDIADVTGAGDALIAGTLAAIARGHPLLEAVRTGIAASAAALTYKGAGNPNLTWSKITDGLQPQSDNKSPIRKTRS